MNSRFSHIRQFLLIVGCMVVVASTVVAAKPSPTTKEELLKRKLERLIIPKLEFREATVREAVDTLLREAQQAGPEGRGINITLRLEPSVQPSDKAPEAVPGIPGLEPSANPGPVTPGESPVTSGLTVSFSRISFIEGLRYVTGLANLKYRIEADGVHIVSLDDPDPMFTRDFTVSRTFKARLQILEEMAAFRKDPRSYLANQGVPFSEGGAAILNDDATRLTVHETRATLDFIKELFNPPPPPPLWGGDAPPYKLREAALTRLRTTVLPKVDLKDIQLSEAVATLKSLGKRYGSSRSKGDFNVPIVFQRAAAEGGAEVATPPGLADQKDDNPNVTYTASKVSLFDALEAVAKLGGYEARVEPYATVIARPLPEGVLVTREWKLTPAVVEKLKQPELVPAPQSDEEKQKARSWLVSSGVTFQGQATAIYIVRTHRLIVRDTQQRIDAVEKHIQEVWKKYREEEAAKGKKEKKR